MIKFKDLFEGDVVSLGDHRQKKSLDAMKKNMSTPQDPEAVHDHVAGKFGGKINRGPGKSQVFTNPTSGQKRIMNVKGGSDRTSTILYGTKTKSALISDLKSDGWKKTHTHWDGSAEGVGMTHPAHDHRIFIEKDWPGTYSMRLYHKDEEGPRFYGEKK